MRAAVRARAGGPPDVRRRQKSPIPANWINYGRTPEYSRSGIRRTGLITDEPPNILEGRDEILMAKCHNKGKAVKESRLILFFAVL